MAPQRQDRAAEARAAMVKIPQPDANVFLQLGLLSLREQQPARAGQEFAQALADGPNFLRGRLQPARHPPGVGPGGGVARA